MDTPLTMAVRLLLLRRNAFDPVMQMNIYPAQQLLPIYIEMGLEVRFVDLATDGDNLVQAYWYLYRARVPESK